MVCTSIGLAVKGVPVVGVIYNPFLNTLVPSSPRCLFSLSASLADTISSTRQPRAEEHG